MSPHAVDWQAMLVILSGVAVTLLALAIGAGWRGVRIAALADRVVVYGLLAALLLSFYVAASLLFTSVIPVRNSYAYEAAAALMALFVAVTYAPVSKLVQRLVDTAFYRDYYDYEGTLERFSQMLAAAYDHEILAQVLLDGLVETLNLSAIAFVLLPEGLDPQVLTMIGPDDLRARGLYASPEGQADLLAQLAHLDQGRHRLPPASPLTLHPWKRCAALLYIGTGQPAAASALLVVGPKVAGGPLRREDSALLLTIAHQAATALANAQLVSGLRISLQQVQISTQQVAAARAEQELLARELVNADERQRASLARDLHDDALQEVLYVIRHSQLAVRLAEAFERSAEAIPVEMDRPGSPSDSMSQLAPTSARLRRELRELAERSAIVEKKLRALCLGLYPDMLHSLGLIPALDDLVEQMSGSTLMMVAVTYDERTVRQAERLDPQVALHLYRIAQEGLSNAHKHGRASAATVELTVLESPNETSMTSSWSDRWAWIRLQVRDNGSGIALPVDIGASLRAGHLGLASMRERAQLIGGQLLFDRAPEGGAQVTVIAPIARILRTIPLAPALV
ncbi:MAG TPA: ATP-binding protein [Ktedonobacterales bacterium]|jgi:signal transduction histidine kinase|nr:ATP-binding protein [Ktedonobacterales bacterium]